MIVVPPMWRLRRSIVAALILAAAYTVLGRLGLWLAIPPGYATPLWPSSGIALAGVLMGGARVWPGIWLGSFLVNIWTAFDPTHAAALLTSVAIPTSIGLGASLQALVGAFLVRHCVSFPSALTRAREIAVFLGLGGPISCLIGSTLGVTTLVVSGQIPWALFPITWGTWWTGDTLGVLIVTPLVLSWLAEPQLVWRRRRVSVALPLVGALALAVVVFGYTRAQEKERLRLLFEREATTLAQSFRNDLDDYLDALYAVESFYASSGGLSRPAFQTFVQRSFARHPGLQALSWDRRVPDALRDAYEEAVRREGYPDFQIAVQNAHGQMVRAARRPEYVVVSYIEPSVGNGRALGFDVASTPDRLEALQQARDTGQPAATGRLMLVQETGRQLGLLVFLPIYGPGLPHATVEERRQNLHGYATGVFQIGDMVEASLPNLTREGLELWIEDETASAGQRLLYDSRERTPASVSVARDGASVENPPVMHWQTTVELAGRRWRLHFAPTLAYLAAQQSLQPWTVLGGGLVFTGALGVFLMIVTGRATVIEQLMVERTAQLDASQRLEASAERRRREAEVLAELAQTINAALDVDAILQRVANGAKELCASDGAAIALCEPSAEAAVIRYWAGTRSRGYHGVRIESGQGIGGIVLATGRPCRTDDYARDPRLSREYLPLIQTGGTVSVLVVPIRSGERVEGLLYMGSEQPRTFTDHDEAILQRLADHAATALANARLYAQVQAGRERLQILSRQLLEAQEAERRRLAHELHDEAGQLLASVHLALEAAVTGLPPQFQECFQPVRGHLDAIEAQLRRLSHELRPTILDDLGLLPALRFYVDAVAARTGLRIRVDSSIKERLPPAVETALYRIMQEGLTNITKHAAATHVRLQLWQDARLVHGCLQDDGTGFAVDQVVSRTRPRGLGLLGIQERLEALGGTLQITSSSGQGTTLQIMLPADPGETSSGADCAWGHPSLPVSTDRRKRGRACRMRGFAPPCPGVSACRFRDSLDDGSGACALSS
jgi:signal transduction histidine kinase/integral membrane sensor domain MASE1